MIRTKPVSKEYEKGYDIAFNPNLRIKVTWSCGCTHEGDKKDVPELCPIHHTSRTHTQVLV